tara:strand:+ start:246 stop:566 length:321 start_codon:yes stop_codon:yes gene_type:complete
MPRISRDKIDLAATGHTCDGTAGCISTATSVYINGRRVLRPGDRLLPHTILVCTSDKQCFCANHPAKVNRGSFTVFAEGIPVARKGDSADKGKMIQGSHNTFANGF